MCEYSTGFRAVCQTGRGARILGYPESVLVRLAIQAELDATGLKYRVEIEAA